MKRYANHPQEHLMKRNTLYRAALSMGMTPHQARQAATDILSGKGSADMAKRVHMKASARVSEARGRKYLRKKHRTARRP